MGIIGSYLIGPHILPPRLSGQGYLEFLQGNLNDLLDEVPVQIRQNMWMMHDGAPAHYTVNVRQWLHEHFPGRWIGRGQDAPIAWPPRSPDLNPCDFYLWSHLKGLVYSTPVDNLDILEARVRNATNLIRNDINIFQRVKYNFSRRLRACLAAGGGHFENNLH